MKDRLFHMGACVGSSGHRAAGAGRSSMAVLALLMLNAAPFAVAAAAYAQAETPTGSSSGVMPEGSPTEIVSGLTIPWSAVIAGQDVLVSQRGNAEILAFRPGEALRSVGAVQDFVARGDGGMLGLAVLEQGAGTWIYAYHGTGTGNRIVRMPYSDGSLGEAEIILDGVPGGSAHNGGRIAFGPDGMLYATVGETRSLDLPQDVNSLGGKILRMTPEGAIPSDNPFPDSLVYSFGHRNPQGLAWDDTGRLWATEFGDDTWDELNRIEPGGNYGWPIVEGQGGDPAYIDPVMQWDNEAMGPSGLAYIDGTFFIAGLTSERLWKVRIDDAGTAEATHYYAGEFGRIRHVMRGADGDLWFLTNTRGGGDNGIYSVPLVPAAAPQ